MSHWVTQRAEPVLKAPAEHTHLEVLAGFKAPKYSLCKPNTVFTVQHFIVYFDELRGWKYQDVWGALAIKGLVFWDWLSPACVDPGLRDVGSPEP